MKYAWKNLSIRTSEERATHIENYVRSIGNEQYSLSENELQSMADYVLMFGNEYIYKPEDAISCDWNTFQFTEEDLVSDEVIYLEDNNPINEFMAKHYYKQGMTQTQMAKEFGVSQAAVSKAFKKWRSLDRYWLKK